MDSCSAGSQLAAVLETLRFAWHVQNTQIPTECVWYRLWVFGSPDVDDLEQVKELLETMFNVPATLGDGVQHKCGTFSTCGEGFFFFFFCYVIHCWPI